MNEKCLEDRVFYIDFLRIIASVAVFVIHVSAQNIYKTSVASSYWHAMNIYDSLCRWGVPIFVMVSGALFLQKDDIPPKEIWGKYVKRIVLAFFFWSMVYYIFGGNSVGEQISNLTTKDSLLCWSTIIGGHYHLWFLPMLVGIYICIPFFKRVVSDKRIMIYYLATSFVFWSVLPTVSLLFRELTNGFIAGIADAIFRLISTCDVGVLLGFAFYFVLGFYLSNEHISKKNRIIIYILGIMGFAATAVLTLILSNKAQTTNDVFYDYNCMNVVLQSVAIFVFVREVASHITISGKHLGMFGKMSFGAYLVHVLVLDRIDRHLSFNSLSIHPVLSVPILSCLVFICAYTMSALMNRIPFIRKYLV